ncbi:Fucose 4-O-acetylase [Xylanibacter ruminicola]|uniref:Fucose 4-O-acetylase n=1 Tax=Xylanibacter ruminicola TaxID=839 RepID=A0A1H4F0E6_XYLRU|nr:acyltransferase family protein [Xylanibacter ruminicola]SEA90774.1 Fucose 4-O-acetylase [Xylanibacter ruminicola]
MKQHLEYIDIAKGIGIIMVVLSHTEHPQMMYYTSAFFVPIFFFCSGYTSKRKNISILRCISQQAVKLLKPYLFFNLALIFYFQDFSLRAFAGIVYLRYCLYPFTNNSDIFRLMVVGNYPMWFLTCMVIAYLLYDLLIYYPKNRFGFVSLYLVITFGATFLPILLPWSLDTAPLMAVIMFCGTQVKESVPNIFDRRKPHWLIVLSFILYFLMLPFCHDINISVRMYGWSIPSYLLAALSGCIAIIWLSRLIQGTTLGKCLRQIGTHSLTIFCIEIPFILFGHKILSKILPDTSSIQIAIITSFTQLFMALAGGYFLSILLHMNGRIRKLLFGINF